MKKFLSLMLALVLVAGLGVSALADSTIPEGWTPADGARTGLPEGWTPADGARDLPEGWTPADGARDELPIEEVENPIPEKYRATITVNGVELDTAKLPGAPAGYVPMRAVTAADGGVVDWYAEEKSAFFFFDGNRINVDLVTCAVQLEMVEVEGVKAYYDPKGFTYLPVSFLAGLDSVSVDDNLELDVERYDITTSSSDPMVMLTKEIIDAVELGANQRVSLEELVEYYQFGAENFVKLTAYLPMMINADTIIIAEVAEGKMEAAKEDLQSKLDGTIKNFEHYLPDAYEVAQKGQIVEAADGTHVMLIISTDNEKAIELFNAAFEA